MKNRYWEIDTMRGIAIICMIVFHSVYLIVFSGYIEIDMFSGFWWIFPRCIAASFLLLVGVSLTISFSRVREKLAQTALVAKFSLRGLMIVGFGACITLVTLFVPGMEGRTVFFGILHLIGVMIVICFFFLRFNLANLAIGIAVIGLGLGLGLFKFDFNWLLWLGFRPADYYPVDYLPILPWGGFVFIGLFLGNTFYRDGARSFAFPDFGRMIPVRALSFLGRHSLGIYLAHIPIIYGILILIGMIGGGVA